PSARSTRACSRNAPCSASTPIRSLGSIAVIVGRGLWPAPGVNPLPASNFEAFALQERARRDPDHRNAETGRDVREDLGVRIVRRGLDDRLRAAGDILRPSVAVVELVATRLEDAGADEDAVRTELHAESCIGRRGDAAGGEGDDGKMSVLGDPAHKLVR